MTEDEMRRLQAIGRQLESDDPGLARALTNHRATSNAGLPALPRTGRGIALLVSAVTGCALIAASIPMQQPLIFAGGALLLAAVPTWMCVAAFIRRRGREPGNPTCR